MPHVKPSHPRLQRGRLIANGLIGAWPFYEGSGNKLHDVSGNDYHGTLTNMDPGTDWVGGRHGYALDFDGTNDYVPTTNIPIAGLNAFSIVAWCKPRAWADNDFVAEKGDTFVLGRHGTVTPAQGGFSLRNATSSVWIEAGFPSAPTLNAWSQLAGVFGGGVLQAFVNGVGGTQAAYSGVIRDQPDIFDIGGRSTFFPFNGLIDDVRIYNRALSAKELALMYAGFG